MLIPKRRVAALLLMIFLLQACGKQDVVDAASKVDSTQAVVGSSRALESAQWDQLVPNGFKYQDISAKYAKDIAKLGAHNKSKEALILFNKINKEAALAPVDKRLDQQQITLSGYVVPLQHYQGELLEFLLVPYYGACIHLPPPPINQTVLVMAKIGEGIRGGDSQKPISITGVISLEGKETKSGEAGYRIVNPSIKPYAKSDN